MISKLLDKYPKHNIPYMKISLINTFQPIVRDMVRDFDKKKDKLAGKIDEMGLRLICIGVFMS